jgi:hypothetical protein
MEKKWIAVLVLFILVPYIKEAYIALTTPPWLVFNGYGGDDAHFYTTIDAFRFGFESPWSLPSDPVRDIFFNNPANGPVFLLAPLGILSLVGISPMIIFFSLKLVSAAFLIIVLYFFAGQFSEKKDRWNAFILIVFTAGLGWMIAVGYRLLTDPAAMLEPFSLFGFGIGMFRLIEAYQSLALALGLLSVIIFARKRYLTAGLLLGLSLMVYPLYAFAIFLVMVLYALVFENKLWFRNILVVFAAALPFGLVWIISYLSGGYYFSIYSGINKTLGAVVLPSIALSLGLPLLFMLYSIRNRIKIVHAKTYASLWIFSLILASISEISQSYWASGIDFLGIVNFARQFYPMLEIPFCIMLAHLAWLFFTNRNGINRNYMFFAGWLFLVSFLLFTPPVIAPWIPMKLIVMITIPASFLAAAGIREFSAKYKISWQKIMALIIIFSLPAVFLYHAFDISKTDVIKKRMEPQNLFYSKSDYDAMIFLKNQQAGVVLCSGYTGSFLPYYSGKKSLLFGIDRTDTVYVFDEKMSDYNTFMDNGNAGILKKYNISYVFYGSFEKLDGNISDETFLERIYDTNGTVIYKVLWMPNQEI